MGSWGALIWYLGRGLQLLGLITVGAAFFVGLSTADSKQELTWMGIGVGEFMLGLVCLRGGGRSA